MGESMQKSVRELSRWVTMVTGRKKLNW